MNAIAMHPERVAGDDRAVRWVMPGGTLPVGRVRGAPGALGALLADGTLSAGLIEHTAVWLWLGEGRTWPKEGRAVAAALREALTEPAGWTVDPAPGEVLSRVVDDLLAGSAGDFIRSHSGSVATRRVGDDLVAITLGGACEHCPAAGHTLRERLMGELRRRCPDAVEVQREGRELTLALGA